MTRHFIILALATFVSGCTTSELRMLNDALGQQAGNMTYYEDQKYSEWLDDVKFEYGIKNNETFYRAKNHGDTTCTVTVSFDDETSRKYSLDSDEGTGTKYRHRHVHTTSFESTCIE